MRYRALIVAFLALCLGLITACSDAPTTSSGRDVLTYDQIRGTGLANKCPQLGETRRGSIPIDSSQSYTIKELCLEPTSFFIKEEPANKRQEAEFVAGKLLTRYTSTIDQVQGNLKVNADNSLTFTETDGLDFQAITVQLPGGERVPFLFTIKNLVAQSQPSLTSINTSTDFEGSFKVPSYRGAAFLDPKGRGVVSGYDNAVALPAQADDEQLTRTNVKRAENLNGKISLQIAKIDGSSGEIAGTFESEQPSDTDLGAGEPKEVKIRGLFYGRVESIRG
ncbi:MAG: photosystem II manganese-stabilizing polypeptide [Nostoc sp. DedQUE08]|uniref:photosystem II manganese-stabilizing polypeptide n=1 Tax=unclassified Nostoc TaxID=2593658 RepID=UPI002AD36CF5|nr:MULTISPECIES: photosystem II manganese-stabilizing polypeptide [unclassified Nostoc]MDZ8033824.1 photosystem II manganese-stabilizing polypeptide [Nostoc sp. DedSLP04]MDZ8068943.1 photosystem II manganese-stabilizing polypeptide [Nostoc sp. DedQUE08]MDZ8095669.1 photosystem II manganese-stabilizing polypeptide [Nostoc sp. DedQUE05]MDZ8127751.1 photosystem II manganese-stabilizing polypeptide [Nostoc sp. DedQUE07]MDZ8137039.1 photosystem II manganese-stabilizing polypeptide [Nostoc sp. DedQU